MAHVRPATLRYNLYDVIFFFISEKSLLKTCHENIIISYILNKIQTIHMLSNKGKGKCVHTYFQGSIMKYIR